MTPRMNFHLETAENEFVWWVDSDDVPELYVAGSSLVEARDLTTEALRGMGRPGAFMEVLADPDPDGLKPAPNEVSLDDGQPAPVSETGEADRRLVTLVPA